MRKQHLLMRTLLLFALIVGSTSAWAEDVTVASGTFNGKNSTYTTGWSTNGTGKGRTDCIIIGKDENITSPSLDLSNYTKITITFTGRRYGSLTGSKATVDASIGGTSKGTIDITNGSVGDVSGNINFVPTEDMTAVSIVFTCTNASSAGSTHGAGIGSITIKGTPKVTGPSIDADDVEIEFDATGGTIESTINNSVTGGVLTAAKKTTADWLTLGSVDGSNVPFTTTTNDGATDRTATVTLTYTYTDGTEKTVTKDVTITQTHEVHDYATLPFVWAGGTKASFNALEGVETNADNSDYAEANAPYRLKFNSDGKFIKVKTDGRPGIVTIGVKMLGGGSTSTITVKESDNGSSYTDVETLSISGSSNDIVNLTSTKAFKESTRYVQLYYTKGSNVGVGPVTITRYADPVTISSTSGFATLFTPYALNFAALSSELKAYTATVSENTVTLTQVDNVPANTGVVLKGAVKTHNVPVIASSETAKGSLEGSATDAMAHNGKTGYDLYMLALDGEGKAQFTKVTSGSIAAGKAYLPIATGGGARVLNVVFDDGETTGISSMHNSQCTMHNEYFDLQGRRVAQPTKGLYIVNGKKVIIK